MKNIDNNYIHKGYFVNDKSTTDHQANELVSFYFMRSILKTF